MKNFLRWALFASALIASPAHGATYYVSPTGNAANTGAGTASPWSMGKADSMVAAGDLVKVMPGSYSAPPNPLASGTDYAHRITYRGNVQHPDSATCTGSLALTKSYVTIAGIKFTGGMAMNSYRTAHVTADSIAWCVGKTGMFQGADHSVITRCAITNVGVAGVTLAFVSGNWDITFTDANGVLRPGDGYGNYAQYDTLSYNIVDCGVVNNSPGIHGQTNRFFYQRAWANWNLIKGNQISGLFAGTDGDVAGRYSYATCENRFEDNKWTFEATGDSIGNGSWNCFSLRDSSYNNVFLRDTIYAGLTNGHTFTGRFVNSGSSPWQGDLSAGGNQWVSCNYRAYSGGWVGQSRLTGGGMWFNVFASKYGIPVDFAALTNFTFYGNTVYSGSTIALAIEGQPLGGLIHNNLIASRAYAHTTYAPYWTQRPAALMTCCPNTAMASDSNFFAPAVANQVAISWSNLYGWTLQEWRSQSGNDANSESRTFSGILFMDSRWATLDLRPSAHSALYSTKAPGGHYGALAKP